MQQRARFGLALAMGVALAVGATVAATSLLRDRDGLRVDELVRVEAVPEPTSAVDEHLLWSLEFFAGERSITEQDLGSRYTPSFAASLDVEALNQGLHELIDELGPVSFVRVAERGPDFVVALGVAEHGTPFVVPIEVAEDGRLDGWGLLSIGFGRRVPAWALSLAVLAGWLFLASGVASYRLGAGRQAWGNCSLRLLLSARCWSSVNRRPLMQLDVSFLPSSLLSLHGC